MIITENFNTADSGTLGPGLSWTELEGNINVVSNKAQSVTLGGNVHARANSDLSSVNHYAQAVVNCSDETNAYVGVFVRKDSSATLTMYEVLAAYTENKIFLSKRVAGTNTNLHITTAHTFTAGVPVTIKLAANTVGADVNLKVYVDDVLKVDFTDTSSPILLGTRTGLYAYKDTSGSVTWDNFEAADLVVATPAISPAAGAILTTDDITITCATAGADIYYTIDGSTPDATDTLYAGAFNLASAATVKAIGIKSGSTDSAVASTAYTIVQVATPAISPAAGAILTTTNITITDATSGASIYYTTDGSTPDSGDTLYSGAFQLAAGATVKAIGIKAGATDSAVASSAFTIATVATPTLDPNGGAVLTTDDITLATATAGSTIYYTLDGSTPDDTDTEYTAPFQLASDATVKVVAIKAGLIDSAVASADFDIEIPAPASDTGDRGRRSRR